VLKAKVVDLKEAFSKVNFLKGRTPQTTEKESEGAFAELSEYRDGGVFITHYTGYSEWERHLNGDEFVQVIEGNTTLFLLVNDQEVANKLSAGQLIVVPKGVWHRFESPDGVKIMTITPQPTDHSIERPDGD